jgi:hypothetical protein
VSGQTGELWIIGAGRAGLALGLLLFRSGAFPDLVCIGRRARAPEHPLFSGPAPAVRYRSGVPAPVGPLAGVLLTVPDAAIPELARELAVLPLPPATAVLHLSGALGLEALQPLAATGCSPGALHPLAVLADPVEGADRLRGAWWGLEAEGSARALARRIVHVAEGQLLDVPPGARAMYHAAAVFASNYLVALLGVAERLMGAAGVPADAARAALCSLGVGTVESVAARGPVEALTGPLMRGDVDTVRRHLASLSETERSLYCSLVPPTLALARQAGLSDHEALRITRLLEDER